jgi:RNA polymerase sigma-B factor
LSIQPWFRLREVEMFAPTTEGLDPAQLHSKHIEFHASHDRMLRAELVDAYRPLASALAARYARHREPHDDLNQAALLGLLNAVDRFDPGRGVAFTTFAWATITGELKRHYRDHTWGVRVPRQLQELYLLVATATDDLTTELGRSPTITEIATRADTTAERVIAALDVRSAYVPMSLDVGSADDDDRPTPLADEERGFGRVDDLVTVSALVRRLPPREQRVLALRFVDGMTQSDIGRAMGISQMQVSRVLAGSLATLRRWVADEPPVTV